MRVEKINIITSITESQIARAVILEIMCVKTFKTDIIVLSVVS